MKHVFIINPASGKEKSKELLQDKIADACGRSGVEYEIYCTKGPLDAVEYIKEYCKGNDAREELCFYACGGDGTFCEVVNGVYQAENNELASVGVIPVGTGNDFVKCFADVDRFLDIQAQVDAEEIAIDLVDCNGFCSANMINIGFDCEVAAKTSQIKRSSLVPSGLAYIFGLVLTLAKKPTARIKSLSINGETVKENVEYLLTTFANGRYCGGGFLSNPFADLCDGRIDAMFINNMRRAKFLSLVGLYKKGEHIVPKTAHLIDHAKCESVEIEFSQSTNVCIDGEIKIFDKILLTVKREALRLRVPRNSANISTSEKDEAACAL